MDSHPLSVYRYINYQWPWLRQPLVTLQILVSVPKSFLRIVAPQHAEGQDSAGPNL